MKIKQIKKLSKIYYNLSKFATSDEQIEQARQLLGVLPSDDATEIYRKWRHECSLIAPEEKIEQLRNSVNLMDRLKENYPEELKVLLEKRKPFNDARNLLLEDLKKRELEESLDEEDEEPEEEAKPKDYSIPSECKIVYVGKPYVDEDGNEVTIDQSEAESIFIDQGVRPSDTEEMYLAAVCGGELVGAATLGKKEWDWGTTDEESEEDSDELSGSESYTFSVAIDSNWQKKNLGRDLVKKIIQEVRNKGGNRLDVWVVNPNMAKLLESMGFDFESYKGWSQDTPYMSLDL